MSVVPVSVQALIRVVPAFVTTSKVTEITAGLVPNNVLRESFASMELAKSHVRSVKRNAAVLA